MDWTDSGVLAQWVSVGIGLVLLWMARNPKFQSNFASRLVMAQELMKISQLIQSSLRGLRSACGQPMTDSGRILMQAQHDLCDLFPETHDLQNKISDLAKEAFRMGMSNTGVANLQPQDWGREVNLVAREVRDLLKAQ